MVILEIIIFLGPRKCSLTCLRRIIWVGLVTFPRKKVFILLNNAAVRQTVNVDIRLGTNTCCRLIVAYGRRAVQLPIKNPGYPHPTPSCIRLRRLLQRAGAHYCFLLDGRMTCRRLLYLLRMGNKARVEVDCLAVAVKIIKTKIAMRITSVHVPKCII